MSSKGKKSTPKHVGLALAVHQKTRSRKLVSLLNKAGHCVSYKKVLEIDPALAELTLESLDLATGAVTPPNIVKIEDATKRFENSDTSFVPVLHITADNIDLLTDTLDGKNTFHATQMVAFQRGGESTDECLQSLEVKNGSSFLPVPDILNFLPENQSVEEEPRFSKSVQLEWYDDIDTVDIEKARAKDFTFAYARQYQPDSERIGWTEFNKSISSNSFPVTASGFMPLILNPAHEYNTLSTVMLRSIAVADKLNYQYVVLTVDQQLHIKLLDVKWSSPLFQERVVLMMGGFHIACNYMKAIGQHMINTGLTEMWIDCGVLSEGSTQKVLSGKAYAKGMRIHKLTYQALWRILMPKFLEFLEQENRDVFDMLSTLSHDLQLSMTLSDNNEITKHLAVFLERESEKNVNIRLWLTYFESVWILLMFTRSVRDGIWSLYLSCLNKMLPLMARYDHLNYLKSMTVYIAEMRQLPSIIQTAFEHGDFVIKKTEAKFNHVAADHAQEWLVGTSKDSGGIIRNTNKQSSLQRWALSFHWRTEITNKTFEMYDLKSKIHSHNEESPSRRKRDNADENTIFKHLEHLNILSTTFSTNCVQNAATKDVASKDIESSLLAAYSEGRKTAIAFVNNRLILQSNSASIVGFHEAMSKVQAPTMANLYKTTSIATLEKKGKSVDTSFLQRITMAYECGRRIDLKSVLTHELQRFPASLTNIHGNLRQGDNNALTTFLMKNVTCVGNLLLDKSSAHLILNGSELITRIPKSLTAKTFDDFAESFIVEVEKTSSNFQRVDVLFDYKKGHRIQTDNSPKRPKLSVPIRRIIENGNVPLPQNMTRYLSLIENEAELSNFLCEKLADINTTEKTYVVSGGFNDKYRVTSSAASLDTSPLVSNHDYVTTRVVKHVINSESETVVVIAKDPEVLLSLIHHFDKIRCKQLWIQMESTKKKFYVPVDKIVESLTTEMKRNILAYQFLTGSRSTSHLLGITKTSGWKMFESNSTLLSGLGESTLTTKSMKDIEEFIVKLYKLNDDSVKTTDLARYVMFRKMKKVSELPPTSDALRFHIYRCHYQAQICKNAHLRDIPDEDSNHSGWRIQPNNEFEPILSSLDAIPSTSEDLKTCGCPQTRCGSNRCACRKNGLQCMPLCKCSGQCQNYSHND